MVYIYNKDYLSIRQQQQMSTFSNNIKCEKLKKSLNWKKQTNELTPENRRFLLSLGFKVLK